MSKKQDKSLIPAVSYCRKSTKGEVNGRARQEKSISQQRAEVEKLAVGTYNIVAHFTDDGVSGWKKFAHRPDYTRMPSEVKQLGAQAIICDNLDRFSRAAVGDVQEDINALRKAGVRLIETVSHGTYDLGAQYDIGAILKLVVAIWSASEYSRQLGRRVLLAKRNRAAQGLRSGGTAPYGYRPNEDKKGGIVLGPMKEQKTVKRIFRLFAEGRSIHSIANMLNAEGIPGLGGGPWYVKSLSNMLRRRVYIGEYTWGSRGSGQFYTLDEQGEVVERSALNGANGKEIKRAAPVYAHPGKCPALIDLATFEKCQARLAILGQDRSRRKRSGLYCLTGVIRCGHCGSPCYGTQQKHKRGGQRVAWGQTIYRCGHSGKGNGGCGQWKVHESTILPFILDLLVKEVGDLRSLLSEPPEHLRPNKRRREAHDARVEERDKLAKAIERNEQALWDEEITHPATRKNFNDRIKEARERLARLDAELIADAGKREGERGGQTPEEQRALLDWFENFWGGPDKDGYAILVEVPPDKVQAYDDMGFAVELDATVQPPRYNLIIDPLKLNQALLELGCKVSLRWKKVERKSKAGGIVKRYVIEKGRFQLGQQKGEVTARGLCTLRGPGTPAAGRSTPLLKVRLLPQVGKVDMTDTTFQRRE
jgi:DNA invertase Pin-like site-specific DNA recombinase